MALWQPSLPWPNSMLLYVQHGEIQIYVCTKLCVWAGGMGGISLYYKRVSMSYMFNARNVTFRTNCSVNCIRTKQNKKKKIIMDSKNAKRALPM